VLVAPSASKSPTNQENLLPSLNGKSAKILAPLFLNQITNPGLNKCGSRNRVEATVIYITRHKRLAAKLQNNTIRKSFCFQPERGRTFSIRIKISNNQNSDK